jgi:uncharacterized membrane protein YeaQ/YmgE (transglycosylase-associated protein family)
MLSLVVFVFIGLIVATIAKALMPGRDPGVGITMLLGTAAQILVWFGSRLIGWDKFGQPWSFFLSIAAAAVLLYVYRETGLDEMLARRESEVAGSAHPEPLDRSPQKTQSLWVRIALAPAWTALGALMLGVTGFIIGFYGPIRFQPWSNQGPMLGIFVTGPGGLVLGALVGGALKATRPDWPMRQRLWILNAANVAYGLFVLDVVADPSWWH